VWRAHPRRVLLERCSQARLSRSANWLGGPQGRQVEMPRSTAARAKQGTRSRQGPARLREEVTVAPRLCVDASC
jgi:hypothetical protein